jgi:uncharacterized membrane protein
VDITNTSTTSHTFGITVSGLPQGWLILSGADCTGGSCTHPGVTLPAGGVGQVGLYIFPTLETLPPPGTPYLFTVDVTATDNPALHETDSDTFTVPAIAFNQLTNHPTILYVTPDGSAAFESRITNVGNVSGTFPIVVTVPQTWTLSDFQSPISNLQPGETFTQEIGFTAVGAALGDEETIRVASPAPGTAYTQTAGVLVRIVGDCVFQAYQSRNIAAQWGDKPLSRHLEGLATQLGRWEQEPANTALRDRTVTALNGLVGYLQENYPLVNTDTLESLAASPTIEGFCGPLESLGDTLNRIGQRRIAVSLRPGYNATLPGQPVTYTLTLENHGALTSTYEVQVIGSDGLHISGLQSPLTLPAGSALSAPIVVTGTALGHYTLSVRVQAVEDSLIAAQAGAGLKVVDAFLRVTDVMADPPFVEAGNNYINLYVSIANVANVYLTGRARVGIYAPDGMEVVSRTVPVTLTSGLHWSSHTLGSVNVAGWTKGVYTVTVQVVDDSSRPIPDGLGFGSFVLGEGVTASAVVVPEAVAPGAARVTTVITTIRTVAAGNSPVAGMNNVYSFYLPDDTWRTDAYDGFYIVGLRPSTRYQVQRFDEATRTWVAVLTDTITMDDVKVHFAGFLPDQLYRIYSDNPLLVVVTSGEGSLVSAATPDLKFRGRHFTFLGDYQNVLGWTRAVIFALEGNTTVSVETKPAGGEWSTPEVRTLQAGVYWYYQKDTDGTIFVRVTSDKDVMVYRVSEDNDELDTVMADNGTPYGKTFYFAPVPKQYPVVFVLVNTEPAEASVTIYDIGTPTNPAVAWQGTVPALGGRVAVPSRGDFFKILSDRTLSAIGGGVIDAQLSPGSAAMDAIWEILETPLGNHYLYQTNMLYSRGLDLVQEYTEFATGLRGQTRIATNIPLVDKMTDQVWGANGLRLAVAVTPPLLSAGNGETVTYTVTVSNLEDVERTYAVSVNGLANNDAYLQTCPLANLQTCALTVGAHSALTIPLRVTARAPRGLYPLEVTAAYETPSRRVAASQSCALAILSDLGVALGLDPQEATGGRGSPALYTLVVTNSGSLADAYDLAVGVPAGWTAQLSANGRPMSAIALTPYVFNAALLQLTVTPAEDAAPGAYPFVVTATSQSDAGVYATVVGTTRVSARGVVVEIAPHRATMAPEGTRSWDVTVRNTSEGMDTFDLMAGGILSETAQFSANPVTLGAGQATVVQLTAGPVPFALPQTYPFAVTARSQGDPQVWNADTAEVTFTGFEGVAVGLLPASVTVTDTLEAAYLAVVTNTGNVDTSYVLRVACCVFRRAGRSSGGGQGVYPAAYDGGHPAVGEGRRSGQVRPYR